MTGPLRDDDRGRAWELIRSIIRQALTPPTDMTGTEWAVRHGQLSQETSARTGQFTPYPYQVGILDAMTDPAIEDVTVKKSARVGYTRCLDFCIGYYIHQEPSPILAVQPTLDDAEDYSKSEIVPMIRDTEVLAKLAGEAKARTTGQTILNKQFRNGSSLRLVGANSPSGFRRITVRVALFDEVDGFPAGAGAEGDQIKLGTKRTETYWNRKIVKGSTPTVKGASRIDQEYETTDQRRFFVPCPHCGEFQTLEWGDEQLPYGIKWKKNEKGEHLPETAYYVCRANACIIEHAEKLDMVANGEWRATVPGRKKVGFHISSLYSSQVNTTWTQLVREWLESKDDPLLRQTFVNLVLGEAYEDRGDKALPESRLASRVEVYPAEVPDGVAVLTAGVDVQDDRVELEIVGWGRNEESWSIAYFILQGDPGEQDFWDQQVDPVLRRVWRRADSRGFELFAACVDSGGHHTQAVYTFSKARLGRRVWAIKGESERSGARGPVWPSAKLHRKKRSGFRPVMIGTNAAKDSIRNRLHLEPAAPGHPCAGFMHFPADRDINYFAQLVSERLVLKEVNGRKFRVWELPRGRANEALDTRVYAYGALCGILYHGFPLNKRADDLAATVKPPVPADIDRHVEIEQLELGLGQPGRLASVSPEPQPAVQTSEPPGVVVAQQPARRTNIASKLAW